MRCVIIGSADINNYDFISNNFKSDDQFVFCDGGLRHADPLGVMPSRIVADFDSYEEPINPDVPVLKLPHVKDDTDSFAAVKLMLDEGYDDFLLIGVFGGRLDHTLGNISLMLYIHEQGAKCIVLDDFSSFFIADASVSRVYKSDCEYFSVVALGGECRGVSISGAKYNLADAVITPEYQYGVSNEVADIYAEISIKHGRALVIIDR